MTLRSSNICSNKKLCGSACSLDRHTAVGFEYELIGIEYSVVIGPHHNLTILRSSTRPRSS